MCNITEPVVYIKKLIKQIIKRILTILGSKKYRSEIHHLTVSRKLGPVFAKFVDKYFTRVIYMTQKQAVSSKPSDWSEYAYAVVGSDQVWNISNALEYYYLMFMPSEKRICYAPSVVNSKFSEEHYEIHKKGLTGFAHLSCREQEVIPSIKQITGKDAQLVLDPTLLFRPEDWRKYEKKPNYEIPEKYILCYFLENKTPEYIQAIKEAAGDYQVITLYDLHDKHFYTNPAEFIYLIDHADFVCTDSFHGTAFAINFEKNFLAFRRKYDIPVHEAMFKRLENLLNCLNIRGHSYESGMKIRPEEVNYTEVNLRLDALRKSSLDFLKECLHID